MDQPVVSIPSLSVRRSWQGGYALAVLLVAYILSFIDRNIMAVLVGPIREAFAISDVQFSLLHGTAFSLFYIVLGLPIGWLADRYSRKWIIVAGVLFWSLMTCLCGLATSFMLLFLVRVGVGVGEATLSPATYSLLGDYFSPSRLRWATAVFAAGITLGTGLSYRIGAWVFEHAAMLREVLPVLPAALAPWQLTFIAVGAPGFIVVLLLVWLKEPARTRTAHDQAEPIPLQGCVLHYRQHRRAYGGLVVAVCMMSVIGYGTMAWFPEWLMRSYAMDRASASAHLSTLFLVAGTAGSLAGAVLATGLQRLGYADANARWVMLVAALLIVPAVYMPLAAQPTQALWLAWVVVFLHYTHFGVAMAALQQITPPRMRALTSALMLFMTNLFGLTLGATLIALVTDHGFGDDQALRYSLAWVAGIAYPAAALAMALSLRAYRGALLPA